MSQISFSDTIKAQAKDANRETLKRLSGPQRIHEARLGITMDSGEVEYFEAFRVQYDNYRGPFKGGIRFHPEVDKAEVAHLAFLMTLKNALLELPYGGGKGGVAIDVKQYSQGELERVSRAYVRAFFEAFGSNTDVPAPDVNTGPREMQYMLDEYQTIARRKDPGAFTGKPLVIGGSHGRTEATGYGGFYVFDEYLKHKNISNKQTIAIQGLGNVGSYFAQAAQAAGHSIVAVSDSSGVLFNESGLDIESVITHKENGGKLSNYTSDRTTLLESSELWSLDVNVLAPAALGGAINESNARSIKASIILELANGPVTPEAEGILADKTIIPDILVNAGGVTVSYFEWVQNRTGESWEKDEVLKKLGEKIRKAASSVFNLTSPTLRSAAFTTALSNLE